jgi:hypothetical protein
MYGAIPLDRYSFTERIEKEGWEDLPGLSDSEEYIEDLGDDGALALLASDNKTEREHLAIFLGKLKPLYLHDLDLESSQNAPAKAIVFGEARPGVPVGAVIQGDELDPSNDRTADMSIAALFLDPISGLLPVEYFHIEYNGKGGDHNGQYNIVTERLRSVDEFVHGISTIPILNESGTAVVTEDKAEAWADVAVARAFNSASNRTGLFAYSRGHIRSIKKIFWQMYAKKGEDLPLVRQTNLDEDTFRWAAANWCLYSYRRAADMLPSADKEDMVDEKNDNDDDESGCLVEITVKRHGIDINQIGVMAADVAEALERMSPPETSHKRHLRE